MFQTTRFHMRNVEPAHIICGLGILYVKRIAFHMRNENFIRENVLIS